MGKNRKSGHGGKGGLMGGRQQQGGEAPQFTESTRIRIAKILQDFRASSDKVYTFDSSVSKSDRAAIHRMCRKMGLISKSTGKNENRCLSVYKNKASTAAHGVKAHDQKPKKKQALKFTEETKNILQCLFTQYPPNDAGPTKKTNNQGLKNVESLYKDNCFCKPLMSKAEITKKIEGLTCKIKDPQLKKISEDRAKLPIASFKDEIMSALAAHQVVLISGETGCGKTTQVPQYILDFMWGKGQTCKVICTQPRRISAISVAERISYERGETVGDTIGYKIRLESKGGKNSSVMLCTNGVLLRMLIGRGTDVPGFESTSPAKDFLPELTHIILDEVHERDRFSDFMLVILRDLLPSYPHLKLLLMSATMDAERFSRYFNCCPVINVPGFTYPVKSFYLGDILSILHSAEPNDVEVSDFEKPEECMQLDEDYKASLDEAIELALSNDEVELLSELVLSKLTIPAVYNYQHSCTGVSPLMVLAGKGRIGEVCMLLSCGASCNLKANDGSTVLEWAEKENQLQIMEILEQHLKKDQSETAAHQALIDRYLETINPGDIDTVLIERLLRRICLNPDPGAILVFLPGWEDISRMKERLQSTPFFRDTSKFLILPLHSMIPSSEQKKVFKRQPSNVRKIILSTNIAETAITINDVVYVIDSGRAKEKSYDPYNNVSTLSSSWISKANAKQREGRAGRCQPGVCYHLYSKVRAASLLDYQVPEIKRMPIEELCLQIKLLDPHCKIADFLRKTMDPPVPESISNAITILQNIGALTSDENLTDLGEKLGSLPVHPSISKMLFFAILMNCLDPALTLACAAEYRDPFLLPMDPRERKRAAEAKLELASLYGGYSDHLTIVAAFVCWRHAKDTGQEGQFCSRYFLSSGTMNMLFAMRRKLQNELVKLGFIPQGLPNCNLNAQDPGILRAVVMAGAYPLVGRLLSPQKNQKRAYVETGESLKVALHSHAIDLKASRDLVSIHGLLLVYDEITRGEGHAYVKCCSAICPFSLLLLATEIFVAPSDTVDIENDTDDESEWSCDETNPSSSTKESNELMSSPENSVHLIVDGWLPFETTALAAAQIYCLRERLSAAILFKVQHPRESLPVDLAATMDAIRSIFSSEGLSGICPPLDPITSMIPNPSSRVEKGHTPSGNRGKAPRVAMKKGMFRKTHQVQSNMQEMPGSSTSRNLTSIPNPKAPAGINSVKTASRGKSFKRRRGSG